MRSLSEFFRPTREMGAVLRNITWLLYERMFRALLALTIGVWLARYLGPELFGTLNFALAIVSLLAVLAGLGLQGVVVRELVRGTQEETLEILGTALMLRFLAGLLSYALLVAVIYAMNPEDQITRVLTLLIGVTLVFKACEVSADWFEAQVLSKYIVIAQNGVLLVFGAIKALAIWKGATLQTLGWIFAFEAISISLSMLWMMSLRGPGVTALKMSSHRVMQLLSDSWPLMLSGIAVIIYMRIDQVMLGWMVDQQSVGVYSAALKLCEAWYMLPTLIVASVFPAILRSRGEPNYDSRVQMLYDGLFVLTFSISVLIWLASDWLIAILFGEPYASSSTIVKIYIWNTCLVALGTARGKWLIAENLQNKGVLFIALSMVVNVLMNAMLIPSYGGAGAAWATIASTLVATLIGPALIPQTRKSSVMLLRSMNFWRLFVVYFPAARRLLLG